MLTNAYIFSYCTHFFISHKYCLVGIARPLEESHVIIRTIGTALPITWSIKGLQAIRFKNKNLLESPVLEAFGYNLVFIVAFSVIIFLLIKHKKIGCIQCIAKTETTPVTISLF